MKNVRLIILMLLISVFCISCQKPLDSNTSKNQKNSDVTVITSRDFGNGSLGLKTVQFKKDDSVMDITEDNFDVETAYGGSFINSIGGLKSGYTDSESKQKTDWFYYVNGLLSQVGSADYIVKPGDVIIWDYHNWSGDTYISSIIGAYPAGFANGYGEKEKTLEILYSDGYEETANNISAYIKSIGISNITVSSLKSKSSVDKAANTILIGEWDELLTTQYSELIKQSSEGAGKYFDIGKTITLLNYKGENSKQFESGGIITSYIKDYSYMNALWLITGNDKKSIEKASEFLYKYPDKLKGKFSLLISGDNIINFPVTD